MIQPDHENYLRSLASEIGSIAQRVRDLIGDAHWLSDGRHKEFLLAELIRRHCPSSVKVVAGFVKDPALPKYVSREQDILIIDTSVHAPLFDQGGLVVASPSQVLGTISVKSNMDPNSISQSLDNQFSVRQIANRSGIAPSSIWCGAFFYGHGKAIGRNPTKLYEYVKAWVGKNQAAINADTVSTPFPLPDAFCSLSDLLFRIDQSTQTTTIRGFKSSGLSVATFMVLLLGHIARRRGGRFTVSAALVDGDGGSPLSPAEFSIGMPPKT